MKELIQFANEASPLGVIAILAIIIWQLVKNSGMILKLRGTQLSDKDNVSDKKITDKIDLSLINAKLDKIANNHLHELPLMKETIDRMEKEQGTQGKQIACLETKMDLIINKKIV